MPECIIELESISKKYEGRQVLENISMKVQKGQSVALMGRNGSGKSTLLRILGGLTRVEKGRVIHRDHIRLAYVPEHFPGTGFKVREYLMRMAKMEGMSKKEAEKSTMEWLSLFFLETMADTPMKYLSKGSLQKVGVIQALLGDPDVLLMDEPLSGQDVDSQRVFVERIKEKRQGGMTVVFSCHERSLVEKLAGQVYEVREGSLAQIQMEELPSMDNDELIFSAPEGREKPELPEGADVWLVSEKEGKSETVKMMIPTRESNRLLIQMLESGFVLKEMHHVQE